MNKIKKEQDPFEAFVTLLLFSGSFFLLSIIQIDTKFEFIYFFDGKMQFLYIMLCFILILGILISIFAMSNSLQLIILLVSSFLISYPASSIYIDIFKEKMIQDLYDRDLKDIESRKIYAPNSQNFDNSHPYNKYKNLNKNIEQKIEAIKFFRENKEQFEPASKYKIYDLTVLYNDTKNKELKKQIERIYEDGFVSDAEISSLKNFIVDLSFRTIPQKTFDSYHLNNIEKLNDGEKNE